jgi:hypothetical protein
VMAVEKSTETELATSGTPAALSHMLATTLEISKAVLARSTIPCLSWWMLRVDLLLLDGLALVTGQRVMGMGNNGFNEC